MEDRSQRIQAASLGTKLLARWVQERSFTTTSFREPISLSAEKNGLCTEASYTQGRVHRLRASLDVGSGTGTRV